MATNGRRTKGAGSIIHRKDGSWEFRREVGRDPATGKRRYVSAKGRTKADARERFDAKVAEMERTGLLPGAKSPYLKDYAERWLEEYRLNVKPTTYRTRAGRIHACMEVIGCIRLTELTPDHIRQCMRVLSKRLAPSTLKDHFVSLKMMLDQAELEELIPVDPCRRVKPPRVEPTECLCSISCCGFSHDDFSGLGRACRPRNGLNWMVLVSPPERTGKDYDQHAPSTVYPSFAAERGIRRVDRAENTCRRSRRCVSTSRRRICRPCRR